MPAMAAKTAAPPSTLAARSVFNFSSGRPVRLAAQPKVSSQGFCTSCIMP